MVFEWGSGGGDEGLAGGNTGAERTFSAKVFPVTVRQVAVEESGFEEVAEEGGGAAEAVEIDHGALAARGEIAEDGGFAEDFLDIGEGEIDAGLAGEGEEVEDAVGRSPGGGDGGGGVFEGGSGEDGARAQVSL